MPLWVRQSPSVSLYTSSSPLKPAKVCPDTGGTKAGAGEAGGSVGAAGVDCGGCDPDAETDPDEADEEAGGAVGSTGTSLAGFCTGVSGSSHCCSSLGADSSPPIRFLVMDRMAQALDTAAASTQAASAR